MSCSPCNNERLNDNVSVTNCTPFPPDLPPDSYGVMVFQGDEAEFLPCPGEGYYLGLSGGNMAWIPLPGAVQMKPAP